MSEIPTKLTANIGKTLETVPEIYEDGLKPTIQESGKTLALIPRTVNAVLAPLRQWIAQREYNVAETEKLLAQKLENINPESIVTPEAYVAVPAFQSISYCINNKELYDLYANLLAKAMIADTKNEVHPAFVDIIKQLSPNDALVLKEVFNSNPAIEAATIALLLKPKGVHIVGSPRPVRYCNEAVYNIQCATLSEEQISISINNLERLGIISFNSEYYPSEKNFEFVKNTSLYLEFQKLFDDLKETEDKPERIEINKKSFSLTPLGTLFCKICVLGIEEGA